MKDEDTGFGMVPRHLRGRLTAYELAVYVALSWRANPAGECYMRHVRIAQEAGCSIATARRALDGLKAKGILTWVSKGDRSCNIYRLEVWRSALSDQTLSTKLSTSDHTDKGVRSHRSTERDTKKKTP